jgi:la-related protein 1
MLILQSLKGSEVLELAEDSVKVRGKVNPVKWPIEGPPIGIPVSSNLHADVPEFVPGQAYKFQPVYTHGMYCINKNVCLHCTID